jgi:hypothetical protein
MRLNALTGACALVAVLAPALTCAASTDRFITGTHGKRGDRVFTSYSSLLPEQGPSRIMYELCNFGDGKLVVEWEGVIGVGQRHPLNPNDCPAVELSAPEGAKPGNTKIKYLSDDSRNAIVHKPSAEGGIKGVISEVMTALHKETSPPLTPSTTPSARDIVVFTRVTNKGDQAQFMVRWTQKIGPLALQVLTTEQSVREMLGKQFEATSNGQGSASDVPAKDLVKVMDSEDFNALPPEARRGTYIYIKPTTEEGAVYFMLPIGKQPQVVYQQTLLLDDKGRLVRYWNYTSLKVGKQ